MNYEERDKWLAAIKAGDEVAIKAGRDNVRIATVTKVTETQIVIDRYRFRRDNGREKGKPSGWYGPDTIYPVDVKVRETVSRDRFRGRFSHYSKLAEELPISTVRKLLAILTEEEQGKENQ
jgi:ribosomal protein L24